MGTETLAVRDTPQVFNYELVAGDDIPDVWDVKIGGSAKDLSACTVTVQLYDEDGVGVFETDDSPAPQELTPGGTGKNELTIFAPLTTTISAGLEGNYTYRVDCVFPALDADFPAGATRCLLTGTVEVSTIP